MSRPGIFGKYAYPIYNTENLPAGFGPGVVLKAVLFNDRRVHIGP